LVAHSPLERRMHRRDEFARRDIMRIYHDPSALFKKYARGSRTVSFMKLGAL
jgi:hypothetical protein